MIIFTQNAPITFEHIDAIKEMADTIKRVREMQQEWEANGNQRLTTEPGPFERHSHYFAGQLRKALNGDDNE